MPILNFPGSPGDNDRYTENGIEYYYDASVGAWLLVVPSVIANTLDTQVIFNDDGAANGSNGLIFDKGANTLYANMVSVSENVSATYFIGDGSYLTGVSSGGEAFDKANAANILAESAYTYAANDAMLAANAAFAQANAANLVPVGNTISANGYYTNRATRRGINFLEGSNIEITVDDDPTLNLANITITSTSVSGGPAYDMANAAMLAANSAYGEANVVNVGNTTSGTFTPRSKRRALNFLEGDNISITIDDDAALNTANITIGTTGASVVVPTQDTAPGGAVDGSLWWNSDLGKMFVYYQDVDTGQWVETSPGLVSSNASGTGGGDAGPAFDQANVAYTFAANDAMLAANSAYGEANVTMNVGNTTAGAFTPRSKRRALNFLEGSGITITVDDDAALNTANVTITATGGDTTIAEAAFDQANTVWDSANSNYTFSANSVRLIANTAYDAANSNYTYAANNVMIAANSAYAKANAANITADNADAQSQAAFDRANSVWDSANSNYTFAANTVRLIANTAYDLANSNYTYAANDVMIAANSAYAKANSANLLAYAALPQSGGTIDGDLIVSGNVTISGNTTYANTETLLIGDNIIELNADLPHTTAPSEDAGVQVNRGSADANVSVLWNEGVDEWQFTNDATTFYAIASNTSVETAQAKGEAAHLSANAAYTYAANDAMIAANSAYAKANAANITADIADAQSQAAFDQANTVWDSANSNYTFAANTVRLIANTAYDSANSNYTYAANNVMLAANSAYDAANSNYTYAANNVMLVANSAYDSSNSNYTYAANNVMLAANAAFAQANAANLIPVGNTISSNGYYTNRATRRGINFLEGSGITINVDDDSAINVSNVTITATGGDTTIAEAAFAQANTVWDSANSNYTFAANTVRLIANTAYDAANSNYTYSANDVMLVANSAYGEANVFNIGNSGAAVGFSIRSSTKKSLNFVEGTDILINIDDDPTFNTVNILITSTATQGASAADAFNKANLAYTFAANTAMLAANSAYGEANVTMNVGNTTAGTFTPRSKRRAINFLEGSGITITIDDDEALNTANVTITSTGGDTTIAEAAFDQANTVWDSANGNYTFAANTVRLIANTAYDAANSNYTYASNNVMLVANSAWNKANTANVTADLADAQSQAAFDQANTVWDSANSNYTFAANTVRLIANTAYDAANSNYTYAANTVMLAANSAYAAGNSNYTYAANTVMLAANSAYAAGNTTYTFAANTVRLIANTAYDTANSNYTFAANTVRLIANTAYDAANSNYTYAANTVMLAANAAFAQANAANLIPVGNTISSNGYYTNRATRRGINFLEGTGITINVDDDPTINVSNVTITSTGGDTTIAEAAFDQANTVWDSANSNYTFAANNVRLIANTAYDAGNTNYTYAANNVMLAANSAYAAGNSNYTYAANTVMLVANTAYDAGNTNYTYAANNVMLAANAAFAQANAANLIPVGNTISSNSYYTNRATRRGINFIEGANITINVDDDPTLNVSNITITGGSTADPADAFDKANAAYTFAANNAMLAANSAYGEANTVNIGNTTSGTFTPRSKRQAINFIEGSNITITIDDDAALNTANVTITSTGGGGSVTTSNTAPGSPNDGDLWWNSENGILYVYYDDGDTQQWVEASPGAVENLTVAVAAFEAANNAGGGPAFDQANTAYTYAANNAMLAANSAYAAQNTTYTYAANTVMLAANSAYAAQNTTYTFAANTVRLIANTAYAKANTNYTYAANNVMRTANVASKSISISSPTTPMNVTLWYSNTAIRVTRLAAVVQGSTPSITYYVRSNSSRAATTPTNVVTAGSTVTSTTTGGIVTTFNNQNISAGNWIWLWLSAESGTVDEFHLTIDYQE